MDLSGTQLLIYIALACFIIGLIIVAVDFITDGILSAEGRNAFIAMIIAAVAVVIVAVIIDRVAPRRT